jgi:hypothetical protein
LGAGGLPRPEVLDGAQCSETFNLLCCLVQRLRQRTLLLCGFIDEVVGADGAPEVCLVVVEGGRRRRGR